jgi:hypothetical protein
MTVQTTHLSQAMKGAATLTALVVQTLSESDPSFQTRFLERLDAASHSLRNAPRSEARALEMLFWTKDILTAKAGLGDKIEEYKG